MAKTQTSQSQRVIKLPTMTRRQLIDALRKQKGATPVTVKTRTVPKMRKTGNPFWDKVVKVSRVNGFANWVYANSVNRQRGRENKVADFVPEPRQWGTRIAHTPLVEHKGNFYLELKVEKSYEHEYLWIKNNEPLDDYELTELEKFLQKSSKSRTQQTDKEIILRDYRMDSIVGITMNGQKTAIVPI